MLKKFQDFAIKGNAFDLAVGVIIGAAFGGIVASLVGDIFMPLVGAVTGGLDFSNYFLPLSGKVTADTLVEAKKQGAVLAWGNFLTIVINFVIVAAVMFGLVSLIQRVRQKEEAKPPPRRRARRFCWPKSAICWRSGNRANHAEVKFRSRRSALRAACCARACAVSWLPLRQKNPRVQLPPPDTEMRRVDLKFTLRATQQRDHAYLHGWRNGANGAWLSSTSTAAKSSSSTMTS